MKYDEAIKNTHTKIIPQDLLNVSFDLYRLLEHRHNYTYKSNLVHENKMGYLKDKSTVKSVRVSFVNVFHQDDFTKLRQCSQDRDVHSAL